MEAALLCQWQAICFYFVPRDSKSYRGGHDEEEEEKKTGKKEVWRARVIKHINVAMLWFMWQHVVGLQMSLLGVYQRLQWDLTADSKRLGLCNGCLTLCDNEAKLSACYSVRRLTPTTSLSVSIRGFLWFCAWNWCKQTSGKLALLLLLWDRGGCYVFQHLSTDSCCHHLVNCPPFQIWRSKLVGASTSNWTVQTETLLWKSNWNHTWNHFCLWFVIFGSSECQQIYPPGYANNWNWSGSHKTASTQWTGWFQRSDPK